MPYRYAAIDSSNLCRGVADVNAPMALTPAELGVYPWFWGSVSIVPCDKSAEIGKILTAAQIFSVPTEWV